ncbi:hypothetical protein [Sporomusa rhizae]
MTDKQPKENKLSSQAAAATIANSNTDNEESKYLHTLEQVMKDRSAE